MLVFGSHVNEFMSYRLNMTEYVLFLVVSHKALVRLASYLAFKLVNDMS